MRLKLEVDVPLAVTGVGVDLDVRLGIVQLEVGVLAVDVSLFDCRCDWRTEVCSQLTTRPASDGENDLEEF